MAPKKIKLYRTPAQNFNWWIKKLRIPLERAQQAIVMSQPVRIHEADLITPKLKKVTVYKQD